MKRKIFERKTKLGIGGISLPLPCFFPSVSSIKTNFTLLEYLQILTALKHPLFLISAYDLYHCGEKDRPKVYKLLNGAVLDKKIVLLDSGNYESYWKNDRTWTANIYRNILRKNIHHLAFSFDALLPNEKNKIL